MKKKLLWLLLLLCLACGTAHAQTYLFPYEGVRLEGQDNLRIITQHNTDDHEAFLRRQGMTGEALLAQMQRDGVLLYAYPASGAAVSLARVAGGGQDSLPESIAQMTEAQKESFLASYADMGLYQDVAWSEADAAWLSMTYVVAGAEAPVYRLRYVTRQLGAAYLLEREIAAEGATQDDLDTMARILSRLSFLPETLEGGASAATPTATPLPKQETTASVADALMIDQQEGITLTVNAIPGHTTTPSLTITGETLRNIRVYAMLGEEQLARERAGQNGAFSLSVSLPDSTGTYALRILADGDDQGTASQTFEVAFTQVQVPLTVTGPTGAATSDRTELTGTSLPGARVVLRAESGSTLNMNARQDGSFSFWIDTDKQGVSTYTLTATLEGYLANEITHDVQRELTEREAFAAFRFSLVEVQYAALLNNPEAYTGKHLNYRGRILAIEEMDGLPCLLLYISNPSKGQWRDPLWVVCNDLLTVSVEDMLTVYAYGTGQTRPFKDPETGVTTALPVLRMAFWAE